MFDHLKVSVVWGLGLVSCARSTPPAAPPAPEPAEITVPAGPAAVPTPTMSERATGAKVWTYTFDEIRVHSYMGPYEAFANTTQVVETPNALVVVDPQMTITFAGDARAFVDSLGKPINRLIVSHAHPDHYLGVAAAWEDVPVYAMASTIAEIETTGEEVRKARVSMFPAGWLTDHVTPPSNALTLGSETIDGVAFVFEHRAQAEHAEQLVVRVPAVNTTIAQDLVYTDVHPIITSRDAIGSWLEHIDGMKAAGSTGLVLPGHGSPTDDQGLGVMTAYLSKAQSVLDAGADGPAFKSQMMEAFPDLGGESFVDFSLFFLYGG